MGTGGEGGIRTHEALADLPVFETSALDQLCDLSMFKKIIVNLLFNTSVWRLRLLSGKTDALNANIQNYT